MRVEYNGDLLVEPSSLRQQPSTVSSHCSNIHSTANIQFSELNQIEIPGPDIGYKRHLIFDTGDGQRGFGFTFNEEEWSLCKKSQLADLEPYERKKMCSLPKSFTPFSSKAVGDDGLECDRNLNRSASNSILLRKCESLNPTPSQFLVNGTEPNNNNIAHPSSLSKILLLHKSQDGFQEDEKENWLIDEGWNKPEATVECNVVSVDDSATSDEFGKLGTLLWDGVFRFAQDEMREDRDVEVEFLPTTRFPLTHSSTVVGTIGSHPNPIISCSADQVHYHHHQDLSTTQQASFPSTIYNFHSTDPILFAEYDDWNANIASLCDNNTDSTPVLYPEVTSMKMSEPPMQAALESGFGGYAACCENEELANQGRAVEEVNTLSTFLSKFDDKVAAIWGQGSSRLGANFLNVDGCISTASTPLGSSNPWGSPSSDISTTHGSSEFRLLQAQQAKQISLAADALLSGGYTALHQNDHFQSEPQSKSRNANTSRVNICDTTISPPKGNYNIMHSLKQYFGTAPPEGEYHIIRKQEATSSLEEMERSLSLINHSHEQGVFVPVIYHGKAYGKAELDLNSMTKALDLIDLDNETEEEWEIVEACTKGKSQGNDGEDLLHSWKTHFRTVDQVELIATARGIDLLESPITAISAHQINPNLPEYRLFEMEIDGEYRVFTRPGNTLFPVKYKVFHQNEKGNQTEDFGFDTASPIDPSQVLQAYKMASDWAKYVTIPAFEFSGTLGSLPRSITPIDARVAYECESLDFQSSDWYNMPKGIEYGEVWGDWITNEDSSHTLVPGADYCDSGVAGVGSRSDYYDDMFGEYDGEYENFSGLGFSFPGFMTTSDAGTDFGQFHDLGSHSGCDASSVSGKQGKSNRRNKARLRPCKYYFLEGSCRRGNDCKFSHDSVTCRYWAEGSCLKGHTCPYVHCFIDAKKLSSQEDYGIRSNGSEKQYHLESEADFPALCSTKTAMLSSQQPMALGFSMSEMEGIRRLEDSLESLTVFTDSNSSVVEEEVHETRRLLLFERHRTSPPSTAITVEKCIKKQNGEAGKSGKLSNESHRGGLEQREWSDSGNRSLSKSKSLGDANSSTSWTRHSVSRSNSHSSATGMSLGIPVKEKRRKKKH